MKIYIYRIKNKINNKSYIGKTKNIKERMRYHFSPISWEREPTKSLYLAFKKHGAENFEKTVLEVTNENEWADREIYWIKHYDSLKNGYNMIEGGTEPPTYFGEEHPMSKLTWENISEIIEDLLSDLPMSAIAAKCNISIWQIIRINNGSSWLVDDIEYPIRKNKLDDDVVYEIINLLSNSSLNQKEIASLFSIGRSTVTSINNGVNHRKNELSYPIRDRYKEINEAKELIKYSNLKLEDICIIYNKGRDWASRINTGKIAYDEQEVYPLRKS